MVQFCTCISLTPCINICRLRFVLQLYHFCYLENTSGVNLFKTIFRSYKILYRFQVNKKLQKSETKYIHDSVRIVSRIQTFLKLNENI